MLELVLTRPHERGLVKAARGLRFLVLDELHTYRGRQGADVALLVRRLKDVCDAPEVQCIGTSATMTTEGGPEEQKKEVARVASTLFGTAVDPASGDRRDPGTDHQPNRQRRSSAAAAHRTANDRRSTTPDSPPIPWPAGSRRSSGSSGTRRPTARDVAAGHRRSPRRPPSSRSRSAETRPPARRPSPRPCRLVLGSPTPRRAAPSSRSGCTSSCPRATTCT